MHPAIAPPRTADADARARHARPRAARLDPETARKQGIALHALLQHLGERARGRPRRRSLERALPVLLPIIPSSMRRSPPRRWPILGNPELAELFGPDSRAEVPFLANARRNGRADPTCRANRPAGR